MTVLNNSSPQVLVTLSRLSCTARYNDVINARCPYLRNCEGKAKTEKPSLL